MVMFDNFKKAEPTSPWDDPDYRLAV